MNFEKMLLGVAVSFILRQAAKFGAETNWETVKEDLEIRARDIIPGDFFDDEVVELMDSVVTAASVVLQSTAELEAITNLLTEKKWTKAGEAFKALVIASWKPESESEKAVFAMLSEQAVAAA